MADRARVFWLLLFILALGAAALFRLSHLSLKPLHTDEAVQGLKFVELLEDHQYEYDPVEYHGPSLYYLTVPVARAHGATRAGDVSVVDLRFVPALFGCGLIFLLYLVRDSLGWRTTCASAVLLALSTPLVYYSRYYIQEILLVFFCLLLICSAWRAWHSQHKGWYVLAGVAAGMAHASKETCIISFAAMAGSILLVVCVCFRAHIQNWRRELGPHAMGSAVALACAVGVSVVFFSSFFTHAEGPLDSITTYANYFSKSQSSTGHEKPFGYYLSLLAWYAPFPRYYWSEGVSLVLFVFGGIVVCVGRRLEGNRPLYLFFLFYALIQLGLYSLISYKTPWLMLNFLVPMLIIAGVGVSYLFSLCRNKLSTAICVLMMVAGAAQMSAQTCRAVFELHSDWRNPYAYSQTVSRYAELEQRLYDLAALSQHEHTPIVIAAENYWPLPWSLRAYSQAGYFPSLPDEISAPIVIVDESQFDHMERVNEGRYTGQIYSLRPELPLYLYVENALWARYMEAR